MAEFASDHYLPWVIGLGFSVLVGHWIIAYTIGVMRQAIDEPRKATEGVAWFSWQPAAQGLLERTLFTAAILVGQAAFVAVWLVLKTATQWSSLVDAQTGEKRQAFHTNYVLGTGLSIGFAGVGAYITELLNAERLTPAMLIAAATVAATLWFAAWIKWRIGRA